MAMKSPAVRRTTLLTEGRSCDRPQCEVWIPAGVVGYHARLRSDMYCSPECRERHTRLLVQTRRRQTLSQREYERANKLLRKYGITPAEWDRLYDLQLGRCAICQVALAETTINVDHDHVTDVVRGLLCKFCNPGLGYFKDDPVALRRAATYLETAASALRVGAGGEVTD